MGGVFTVNRDRGPRGYPAKAGRESYSWSILLNAGKPNSQSHLSCLIRLTFTLISLDSKNINHGPLHNPLKNNSPTFVPVQLCE